LDLRLLFKGWRLRQPFVFLDFPCIGVGRTLLDRSVLQPSFCTGKAALLECAIQEPINLPAELPLGTHAQNSGN
jgi:hypothetical protein